MKYAKNVFLTDNNSNPIIQEIVEKMNIDSVRAAIRVMQSFETRKSTSSELKQKVAPWLFKTLKAYCDSVYYETFLTQYGPNVIGIKIGKKNTSVSTYCAIGGHYDAVNNAGTGFKAAGANDNASGVAALLEAARVMKSYQFENTIRFECWNAEESSDLGSDLGSKASALDAKNGRHTIIGAVFNFDMIAHTSDPTVLIGTLRIFGTKAIADNEIFATRYIPHICSTYTTGVKIVTDISTPIGGGSDQSSWVNQGFSAIQGLEADFSIDASYHKAWDTLDCPKGLNNMRFYGGVVQLGIATMADLAIPMPVSYIYLPKDSRKPAVDLMLTRIGTTLYKLALYGETNTHMRFELYNAAGRKIISVPANRERGEKIYSATLDTRRYQLTLGVYLVTCVIEGGTIVKRVVID
jgi:hypothetical protein